MEDSDSVNGDSINNCEKLDIGLVCLVNNDILFNVIVKDPIFIFTGKLERARTTK